MHASIQEKQIPEAFVLFIFKNWWIKIDYRNGGGGKGKKKCVEWKWGQDEGKKEERKERENEGKN